MRKTHWAAFYLTNPNSWYPVPERARILSAIPAIQPLPPDRKQRWQELELPVVPLSERNSAGRTR